MTISVQEFIIHSLTQNFLTYATMQNHLSPQYPIPHFLFFLCFQHLPTCTTWSFRGHFSNFNFIFTKLLKTVLKVIQLMGLAFHQSPVQVCFLVPVHSSCSILAVPPFIQIVRDESSQVQKSSYHCQGKATFENYKLTKSTY